jgi:hypothetical protein
MQSTNLSVAWWAVCSGDVEMFCATPTVAVRV